MSTPATTENLAGRLDKLYEFEREPVSPDQLKSGRYFAACFAGEHVAATEFVIGAMFAKYGVSAHDLIYGLVLGNLLAVFSWAFLCAPIAVRVRLTLYWYLRRVAGPGLTVVYSIVNGILFCILAGAMIAVSASAVSMGINSLADMLKLGTHIRHPSLNDLLPNSIGWVVTVLIVGAVVVSLAIMGFKRFSQFSAVCSPWMFIIFIAGAVATLPALGEIRDWPGFWRLAESKIWTGIPEAGQSKLGFWHIVFFAWFCNLATHVGLSDMALFRYARKWTYGFYSAFGMFLGHYLSWICAGIMGAAVAGLNPGEMSLRAAGVAGPLAVLLAGWTTANPTMYRAGLALQIATPNWPRWRVTLVAGAITTILACFPVFFVRLLDFVAIYGLVLMPIGAIVLVEHWLFPWLGLRQYWTEHRGKTFNPAALLTWIVVLIICFPIEDFTGGRVQSPMAMLGVHLYFRWLPGWFIAVVLYPLLARLMGAAATGLAGAAPAAPTAPSPQPVPHREVTPDVGPGAWIAGGIALLSLAVCLALPIRVLLGGGADPQVYAANMHGYKHGLLVATVVYFITATIWQTCRGKGPAPSSGNRLMMHPLILHRTSATAMISLLTTAAILSTSSCSTPAHPTRLTTRPATSAPASEPAPASQLASRPAEPPITIQSTSPVQEDYAPDGLQRIDYVSGVDGKKDWALVLPGHEPTWIVCIHGHGSTGNQLYTRNDIRRTWMPAFTNAHLGIVTPNLRDNAWMSPAAAADLHGLLQHLRAAYHAERFILASGSMGGTSNLIYAVLHPEDAAGVIALCPASDLTSYYQWCRARPKVKILQEIADAIASAYGCEPAQCPDLYRSHSAQANVARLKMPVYVAHGAQDLIIPVTQSRQLADAINLKGTFRYCEIPEGDHDAPLRDLSEALDWVLKRMR